MKSIGSVLGLLLMASALPAQNASRSDGALRFLLVLPDSVPSEAVQIRYFSSGEYGGNGGFLTTKAHPKRFELDMPASTHEVKVIAYLPGCRFETLILTPGMSAKQKLECHPLRTVELRGRIEPRTFLEGKSIEVEARYLASWDHEFFGIADGMVSQFVLAKVSPDEDGSFRFMLPDFAKDPTTSQWRMKGEWQLFLREIRTGNIVATLHPKQYGSPGFGLEVLSSYPEVITFGAVPH